VWYQQNHWHRAGREEACGGGRELGARNRNARHSPPQCQFQVLRQAGIRACERWRRPRADTNEHRAFPGAGGTQWHESGKLLNSLTVAGAAPELLSRQRTGFPLNRWALSSRAAPVAKRAKCNARRARPA